MFILAACAGILLLAGNPHGGEHLKDLLVGQILWVNTTQLAWLGGLSAVLLAALWLGWVERLGRFGFYGAFALAVTASVQLDRKSTRLNSSHIQKSRMPSSA